MRAAIHLRSTVTGDARRAVLPLSSTGRRISRWAPATPFTQLLDARDKSRGAAGQPACHRPGADRHLQPGAIVRPYQLAIPADAAPGLYELHIGLRDAGRPSPVTLPGGTVADHLTFVGRCPLAS